MAAQTTNSRKDFIRKLVFGLGGAIIPDPEKIKAEEKKVEPLTFEQIDFLHEYGAWLKEFQKLNVISKGTNKIINFS